MTIDQPDHTASDPSMDQVPLPGEELGDAVALLRKERLLKYLNILEKQGITQSEVARRTDVPPQYLNDVKAGRRSLSERFARRMQDEFLVNYQWLLGNHSSPEVPRLDPKTGPAEARRIWLPVFAHPIDQDPFTVPGWDGSSVEIAGAAALRALHAKHPYALRFGAIDQRHRLCRGDLLLVSQAINNSADIQVIRLPKKKYYLARRQEDGEWECLNPQNVVNSKPLVIGHVLGILWGTL